MRYKIIITLLVFLITHMPATGQIRIMPLGNSITQAEAGYDSYRRILWHTLVDSLDFHVDFVGSLDEAYPCSPFPNLDFDPDHEGHWSWHIDQIVNGRSGTCFGNGRLGQWIEQYQPHIYLVHLGTNDCWQGESVASSALDLQAMIDTIRLYTPTAHILLGQLIQHQIISVNACIATLNDSIAQIANRGSTSDSRIIPVDLHSDFDPFALLYDAAHPNTLGEAEMANRWAQKLVPLLDDLRSPSIQFSINSPASVDDYGKLLEIPDSFGKGEFTFQMWIKPDSSFPVGSTNSGVNQITNWSDADPAPYGFGGWWFNGNFLLDGHQNSNFAAGTFSLQFYGGGRLRWHFGDGYSPAFGDPWVIQAYPASSSPTLLDGQWHLVSCVRKWTTGSSSTLELWIDDTLVADTISPNQTNMRNYWDNWTGWPQPGFFFGAEKQAAENFNLTQYEDYKGLMSDVLFYSRAKSASEIIDDYILRSCIDTSMLKGRYSFVDIDSQRIFNQLNFQDTIQLFNLYPAALHKSIPTCRCASMQSTYLIHEISNPASHFASLSEAVDRLHLCGMSNEVILQLVEDSIPKTEFISITPISGNTDSTSLIIQGANNLFHADSTFAHFFTDSVSLRLENIQFGE